MVNSVEMVPLHNMRDVEEEEKEEGHVVVLERVDDKESLQKLESLLFLRVLLVEEDDSSRMIISALLRKCGYQVAAVPDGLKAWEILKGKPNNIDLVLTEVEVPSIAGVSLLGMIMEDDICRRIPVIMMSSQDSVNVVFNCMLRGAVDFLVKPLRKNELRNLWQHVWRRQSLSNSGNSSQNVNPLKRKIEAIDESCSNKCSSDCVAHSKRHKECSEKGSDAQSSCAKPEMEVESANMQIVQNLSHPECRTDLTTNGKKTLEYGECVELNNILLMHEDRAKDKSSNLVPEVGSCNQSNNSTGLDSEEELAGARITTHGQCVASQTDRGDVTIHNETIEDNNEQLKPSREAMDLIGAFDNHSYSYNTSFLEAPLVNGEVHFIPNDGINKCSSTSLLELSLRRPQSCDQEIPPQLSEKNTLNHSNASAFSWYSNRPLQPSFVMSPNFCTEAKECTGISCKHVSNQLFSPSAEVPSRNDSTLNSYSETMSSLISNQSLQGKESDACSQQGTISVPIPVSATRVDSLCSDYGAIFPTLFYTQSGPLPLQSSISANQQKSPITVSSSDQFNHENRDYQQAGCLHGQSVNKAINPITHEQPEKKLESCEGRRHVSNATAQTSSSSLCNSAVSHLNSSGCASDCNGSNGNVTAVTIVGSSAGSGNDKGISFQDGSRGTDSYCFNKREAALTKFRLKRKDRCFDKKVRYQSRKRLAEQRPRVKGQFVRLPA